MNKFFFLATLISLPVFAARLENVADIDLPGKFNPRESHWLTSFGFEGMKYETPFEFSGDRKNLKPGSVDLWGGRIGVGGEIYLGKGILTTSKVEGYYMGTLFSKALNGGPEDESIEFAYTKQTGQIFGFDASQALGFMFDMKTKNPIMDEWTYLTVEPYIEAGIGMAWAQNRVNYQYDTGTSPSAARESYQMQVADNLLNARIGAGINFTSSAGFFLYTKATINRYDITKRKISGFSQPNGQAPTSLNNSDDKNAKLDAITVYAIGGGYKF